MRPNCRSTMAWSYEEEVERGSGLLPRWIPPSLDRAWPAKPSWVGAAEVGPQNGGEPPRAVAVVEPPLP